MRQDILGYGVNTLAIDQCVDDIFRRLRGEENPQRRCAWLACLNPHSYVVAVDDPLFSVALKDADWLVPDGAGVVMASQLLGRRVAERVTGSDVFIGLCERMNSAGGMSVFFLGATEDTLDRIRARMANDYPGIRIAGTYSPPFRPIYSNEEIDAMINAINTVRPDVLWVGMTAPKQEKWIYANRDRLQVRFAGAVGAVFDFYAGRVKRSHPVFQRLGLEWLPRLIQQPRRLWRRMFVSAPIFVWHVCKEKVRSASR
ncbi:MAG: WecB/TagA/CpsF family glycosyltransferase [Candidatus Accumulibacter sp.]|uniref:WecB/TagA/CpsF family glycosyltransferase n=1 Tax=Accumulibacter sp. TaxID=2053492 RepID=UPI00258EF953|nr:WecB/TagA/CpsF family glycosyltransferase [Accumulibacter sp.]MCM8621124.1 WecB/TagA/CpsF family glycosyltransferase [Accumulibacter sp.]